MSGLIRVAGGDVTVPDGVVLKGPLSQTNISRSMPPTKAPITSAVGIAPFSRSNGRFGLCSSKGAIVTSNTLCLQPVGYRFIS